MALKPGGGSPGSPKMGGSPPWGSPGKDHDGSGPGVPVGWVPDEINEAYQEKVSAFNVLVRMLQQYGIDIDGTGLSSLIWRWIQDGITDTSELEAKLQETDEWKKRFAGNEKLRQAGLPVLSVAEYLSVEKSYAQVMKNYGLPTGFYDDPSDFSGFIGASVSASELQSRVQLYADVAKREDPALLAQLQSMGLSEGDILSYFVDPDRALPILQRKYQTAILGSTARRQEQAVSNNYLGYLADLGVDEQTALTGFGSAKELTSSFGDLGAIYGEEYTAGDANREVFENNAAAKKKRKRLASHERAAWSGEAGADAASFRRLTGGAY